MLATHAAVSLIAVNRQEQFESALTSRAVIAHAKGTITERFDIDAVRDFELVRRLSQDANTPVTVIARALTTRGITKDAIVPPRPAAG